MRHRMVSTPVVSSSALLIAEIEREVHGVHDRVPNRRVVRSADEELPAVVHPQEDHARGATAASHFQSAATERRNARLHSRAPLRVLLPLHTSERIAAPGPPAALLLPVDARGRQLSAPW